MTPLSGKLTSGHRDFLRVLGFGVGYLPAAVIPRRLDPWVIDNVVSLLLKLRPEKPKHLAARMAETVGTAADLEAEARQRYELALEAPWARVRNLHRDGWRPEIKLEGLDRIEASRARGKGTLLWRTSMGSTLLLKRAMWKAGVPLVHLSTTLHGSWSESRAAEKYLAPLYRRTEKWYLKERVIIPRDRSMGGVMKTLLTRLSKENAVVSIVGDLSANQTIRTPFFDREAGFAMGSPALAWKAGSALLPTYCIREGTGRYRVVVDEPISVDRELARKEYVRQAVMEYSRRLQERIVQSPGSWSGWTKFWARQELFAEEARTPSSTSSTDD